MGCMHAVSHCLQRRGLHSDGGAFPRMEHAKRRSASTSLFYTVMLSQEDAPRSHRTTRQIRRETGISQTSVMRIIHVDLQLKCLKRRRAQELTTANRLARLSRSKQLLLKFSPAEVDFIFFTDEKVFTVAPPVNPRNDRSTHRSQSRNATLLPKDCFEYVQLSASRSLFRSLCPSLAVPV